MPRADSEDPLEWVFYEDEQGNKLFFEELTTAVHDPVLIDDELEPPHDSVLQMRISEIKNLMARAEAGSLKSPNPDGWNEWGHAGSNPNMWEIRHQWSEKRHVRIYHGEPPGEPLILVACGCQLKGIDDVSEAIKAEQTEAIQAATTRYQRRTSGL